VAAGAQVYASRYGHWSERPPRSERASGRWRPSATCGKWASQLACQTA